MKIWFTPVVFLVLGLFLAGGVYFFKEGKLLSPQSFSEPAFLQDIITPTPVPFEEMTIPFLRSKNYQSNIGEMEQTGDNSNYTTYLTSYTSDGLKINGLLTRPKGNTPEGGWPAVVFLHGYIPPTLYQTSGPQYTDYVDYLARNGFVVFKVDLRGHGDSEGDPGGAYYSSDYIIDALNAYAALQSTDYVNKDAIGFWGHSMAGNVLMRTLAAKPDIPAIVIWAGAVYTYTDFGEYGISDNSYRPPVVTTPRANRRQLLFNTHGQFDPNHSFWKQVPATNYLGEIKGAVQLHHAVNDDVVDVRYSQNLDSILDKTAIPHDYFEYQSGGHNLTGSSFTQAMQRTVEFYKKYLKVE